jgi:VWFA-related protein
LRLLTILTIASLLTAQAPNPPRVTFSTTTNVVVVDVRVTDANGKPVNSLTKDDFVIFEDNKQQNLLSCDLQKLETTALPAAQPELKTRGTAPAPPAPPKTASPPVNTDPDSKYRDRRLIVMLFDLSSMQPPEQIRAVEAATKFINTQLTRSDMVSVMTFGVTLRTVQDFTDDRDLLAAAIHRVHIGESSEQQGLADTGADAEDQSGSFVADETEFNIFNTDLKLAALEDAARRLAPYPEKKALVYISAGVDKTGVDNQSQLRATVNEAVRANVAFYPIDARGLVAQVPGGDASQAGAAGTNLYRGAAQASLRNSLHDQQETLVTLAADTGGKALLDSNDLTLGMTQVQKDIESYYILTYASTNAAEDGRYRRIQVKLAPRVTLAKAKLDFRKGYFAPTTFARMSEANKEAQLQRALESENPITDLPLAVELDYFRIDKSKYFVPVSVEIPGSALAFHSKGSKAATELDFTAEVRDAHDKPAAAVRDTIPLKLDEATAGQVTRKHIQYDTGLTLTPGKYKLRFVARENGEGKLGTFETPFTIPDLSSGSALRFSSVIFSNQRGQQSAGVKNDKKLVQQNPLIDSTGQKIVPNVIRVFRPGQDLYVYLEVYDPTIPENLPQNVRATSVAADLALFDGSRKVLETAPVRVNRPDAKRSNTIPLRLQASLKDLKPGKYVCQVNIIDELGRKFAFPRTAVVLLPAAATAQSAPAGAGQ